MKKIMTYFATIAAIAFPAVAHGQDDAGEGFAGVTVGLHDLGVASDVREFYDVEVDDSGMLYGVFAGYDVPVGSSMFAGVEGNFHLGSDVIDSDYGVSARLGMRIEGGAKLYLRGGYQWVDMDPYEVVVDVEAPDDTFDGYDASVGDYLVGLGVDYPVGKTVLRANIDTIAFDSLRATAGVGFRF